MARSIRDRRKKQYIKKTAGSPEERKCQMALGLNCKSLISNKDRKEPPGCWAGSSFLAPARGGPVTPGQTPSPGSQMCLVSLPVPQAWGCPQVLPLHPCDSLFFSEGQELTGDQLLMFLVNVYSQGAAALAGDSMGCYNSNNPGHYF